MSKRVHRLLLRIVIATMLLGIVGMFQPFRIELYTLGFHLVLIGTLAFIVVSHIVPRDDGDKEIPVSV
jgi:hypothetical protein